MPIIVGVPRSGTTLLRFMIDAHPSVAIPPETGFLAAAARLPRNGAVTRETLFQAVTSYPPEAPTWPDFGLDGQDYRDALAFIDPFDVAEGIRAFYRLYAGKQNKPRYGDKTPTYCDHIEAIESLLPEAHFIHIIRDGRDVALSLRGTWFAPVRDIPALALYWSRMVRQARQAGDRSRAYREVRYEDLVRNPQPVLEGICDFVKLDFDPALLHYWRRTPERLREQVTRRQADGKVVVRHEQRLIQQQLTMKPPWVARLFAWKREMSASERNEFLRHAGGTLEELGYEV